MSSRILANLSRFSKFANATYIMYNHTCGTIAVELENGGSVPRMACPGGVISKVGIENMCENGYEGMHVVSCFEFGLV